MSVRRIYAVYIPKSDATVEICKMLASEYDALRERQRPKDVKPKFGDDLRIVNQDQVFTGRIFIFHETDLTDVELKKLWNLYKSKNLTVTFRGPTYLAEKKAKIGPRIHQ